MEPSLTTRLLSLPQGTHQSLRFNQVLHQIYYLALLLHLGFFVVFLSLGIGSLALFNLASIATYLLALALNHGRHWSSVLLLVYVEVVLHAILTTVLLGWMAGFPYYLFAVGPVVLLNSHWPLPFRLVLAALAIIVKGLLYLFFGGMGTDLGRVIWAFSNPGMERTAASWISNGRLVEIPFGYSSLVVRPSGSTKIWCESLSANRFPLSSMDGQ